MRKLFILFMFLQCSASVWAAKVYVGKYQVTEEEGISDGESVVPNEGHPYLWAPVVNGKRGSLISVGTFRVPTLASFGAFDLVINIDIDQMAIEVGHAHQALVQAIAKLGCKTAQQERELYLAALSRSWTSGDMPEQIEEPVAKLEEILSAAGFESEGSGIWQHLVALYGDRMPGAYWANDNAWVDFRDRIVTGRSVVLNGNLVGSTTLKELGGALKGLNSKATVIDLSNALEHLAQSETGHKQLVANLDGLVSDENAMILFTADVNNVVEVDQDDLGDQVWLYFSATYAEFRKALINSKALDDLASYEKFLKAAAQSDAFETAAHDELIERMNALDAD